MRRTTGFTTTNGGLKSVRKIVTVLLGAGLALTGFTGTSTPVVPESDPLPSTSAEPEVLESPSPSEPSPDPVETKPVVTDAVITVQVQSDRVRADSVAGVAGVRLRLNTGGNAGPEHQISADWATCVSDAAGICRFTVPDTHTATDEVTAGEHVDQRFWVTQDTATANAHPGVVDRLRTGEVLRAGNTYAAGVWQVARSNPQASLQCQPGVQLAVVVDAVNAPELTGAVTALVEGVAGTNSTVTVYNSSHLAAGLWQAAVDRPYDLTILVTPTLSSTPEFESAVASANAVKATGSRVVAVGIGQAEAAFLRALSGQQGSTTAFHGGADFYQLSSAKVAQFFGSVAQQTACDTTVQVAHMVSEYGQDVAQPADADWQISLTAPQTSLDAATLVATDREGEVSGQISFTAETPQPIPLTVEAVLTAEQRSQGWRIAATDCQVNGGRVHSSDVALTLSIIPGDQVTCSTHAVQVLQPAMTVIKTATTTVPVPAGSPISAGESVTFTYLVTNTGETVLQDVRLVDDQFSDTTIQCPSSVVLVGGSMTCTATGVTVVADG